MLVEICPTNVVHSTYLLVEIYKKAAIILHFNRESWIWKIWKLILFCTPIQIKLLPMHKSSLCEHKIKFVI